MENNLCHFSERPLPPAEGNEWPSDNGVDTPSGDRDEPRDVTPRSVHRAGVPW